MSKHDTWKRFDEYLVHATSSKGSLSQEQTKGVFLRALKDFLEGEIDLSQLASIATELYYSIGNPFKITAEWEHDLGKALSDATEIDYYYEHREGEKDVGEREWSGINSLKRYYEENKQYLEETERQESA